MQDGRTGGSGGSSVECVAQGDAVAVPAVQVKVKKCRTCNRPFTPRLTTQVCCQTSCAIRYAQTNGEKRQSAAMKRAAMAERREALERLKPISKLLREAQYDFNRYIRERDYDLGCISCHMPANYDGQWQAGHYRTTKAAPQLRFSEVNVHKQCAQCNGVKSGNIIEFRKGLLAKLGVEIVEQIENDNATRKWLREELALLRLEYKRKWRALKKAREARA